MAANIGPLFSLQVSVPAEWNLPGLQGATQVAVEASDGQGFVLEVFSKALRQALLEGNLDRVFIAQVLREDDESYFAFSSALERALFIELRELDSIGSKYAALAVSEIGVEGLRRMSEGREGPGTALKIPGLGPKTVEKLRAGLKDRRERFARLFALLPLTQEGASADSVTAGILAAQGLASGEASDVPPLILQAMSKVGLRNADTIRLFRQLWQEDPDFLGRSLGEQIKLILSRYGQSKARLTVPSENKAEVKA